MFPIRYQYGPNPMEFLGNSDISSFICRVTRHDPMIKETQLYFWWHMTYTHHPTKFGSKKSCRNEFKATLILRPIQLILLKVHGRNVSNVRTY